MPDEIPVTQFKYPDAKRKHIPPSGEMATNKVREEAKVKFAYDPHRTPALRFNEQIGRCRELLEKSTRTILQREEAALAQCLLTIDWLCRRETVGEMALSPSRWGMSQSKSLRQKAE